MYIQYIRQTIEIQSNTTGNIYYKYQHLISSSSHNHYFVLSFSFLIFFLVTEYFKRLGCRDVCARCIKRLLWYGSPCCLLTGKCVNELCRPSKREYARCWWPCAASTLASWLLADWIGWQYMHFDDYDDDNVDVVNKRDICPAWISQL